MSARALRRLLVGCFFFAVLAGLAVRTWFALGKPAREESVVTWWRGGVRIAREVLGPGDARKPPPPDVWVAEEVVVGEAPLYLHPVFFTLGLVPGRDGVKAMLDGKVAYATVDDLLSAQAYDRAHVWEQASFGWGTHQPTVVAILADQLGVSSQELTQRATFRRVRFERRPFKPPVVPTPATMLPIREWPERVTEENLTRELVMDAVREAASHLTRSVGGTGEFRYLIDASTNKTVPGYNWPRHSGATFFLAQAAAVLDNPTIRYAALRAAGKLRDQMMRDCGEHRCIAPDVPQVEIGSTALAMIAFTEIVRTGADGSYRPAIAELAAFLRSQQRPDGELMHLYDRVNGRPIDVQFLYFTGEAALALARAHEITGDPRDLEAARRALARLSGAGWSFFGSRYYFGEEHWTCQAVAELWDRAPDEAALEFCSRWHEFQRRLQLDADETPFDADGSFGFGPLMSPRITPASSRGEAAGALAHVLWREKLAGRHARDAELVLVERELRRAVAFVMRQQFHPGPCYLFADPVAVRGAIPGSPVDWQLRIDYAQHAGSMMVRWLEIDALARGESKR
jgi:hypothetical protein